VKIALAAVAVAVAGGVAGLGLLLSGGSSLSWEPCGAIECATIVVPLDYDHPDGRVIELAVARRRAIDRSERIGTLLLNPGGPGSAAISYVRDAGAVLPREVLRRFDIVAVDPRGAGRSEGLACSVDPERLFEAEDAFVGGERKLARQIYRAALNGCLREDPEALPFLGTVNHARDLDRLREALGEDRVAFIGFSYGTLLGAAYAHLFPDRVRAMVLDSGVLPGASWEDMVRGQAASVERALERFFATCPSPSCDLQDARATWLAAAERLTQSPIRVGQQRLGVNHLVAATYLGLAGGDVGYPILADMLRRLQAGDAEPLRAVTELFGSPQEVASRIAIDCADSAARPSDAALVRLVEELKPVHPLIGWRLVSACPDWWPRQAEPFPDVAAGVSSPIMVIGTTNDPVTPYAWSQALAKRLGSAVVVTNEGITHTATSTRASCMDRVVARYLVDGDAPASARCP
jgi:pimeloyl-ACP methyl ester carboxylesterase